MRVKKFCPSAGISIAGLEVHFTYFRPFFNPSFVRRNFAVRNENMEVCFVLVRLMLSRKVSVVGSSLRTLNLTFEKRFVKFYKL